MQIKTAKWSLRRSSEVVNEFLNRPAFDEKAEAVAREVLAEIRVKRDAAVAKYAKKFDKSVLKPSQFSVSAGERKKAMEMVDSEFKRNAMEARKRLTRFAQAGLRKDWSIPTPKGGVIGEQFIPLARVGCYIPAGEAPLASTALHTVTLARVAGVTEVIACTPADKEGRIDPYLLYTLDLAGATKVFKVGGIQAIGAMAYGTKTIPKVDKIVGPGGPYVTAAKRIVYGAVNLDMVAGPSEIAILADETARPEYIAADLLSQAEHGTGQEKALLVTTSMKIAKAVEEELVRQTKTLSRKKAVQAVLENGTLLVVVDNLNTGMELCNRFAPEHMELLTSEPRRWAGSVKNAGAVFLGAWTPECAGDFVAGPSHVLPTGGTASMFSGLTVESFRRRTSMISFTRADLQDALPVIEAFGRVEQLDAHAKSARIRFEKI